MGEGVQQDVPRAGMWRRVQPTLPSPVVVCAGQELFALLDLRTVLPLGDPFLGQPQEDPLSAHLRAGQPGRPADGQRRPSPVGGVQHVPLGGVDPGEAVQRGYLPEAGCENHFPEPVPVRERHRLRSDGEVGQLDGSARGEGPPLGPTQVGVVVPGVVGGAVRGATLDRRPDPVDPVGLQLRPATLRRQDRLGDGGVQAGEQVQRRPQVGDHLIDRMLGAGDAEHR